MTVKKPDAKQPNQGPAKDTAGVIAPPPVLYLAGLLLGLGADRFLDLPPLPYLSGQSSLYLAIGLGAAGFLILLAAAGLFVKAGTNIQPHHPTTALVTGGFYRFSRNPIYLGVTLVYLGLAAGLASLGVLALLPAVLAALHLGVIRREERYLEEKFGSAYLDYKARVRRWI